MAKILGVENVSFTGRDGTAITGKKLHAAEPIDPKRGVGEATENFFLSEAKLSTRKP